jgi:hypothetical protein
MRLHCGALSITMRFQGCKNTTEQTTSNKLSSHLTFSQWWCPLWTSFKHSALPQPVVERHPLHEHHCKRAIAYYFFFHFSLDFQLAALASYHFTRTFIHQNQNATEPTEDKQQACLSWMENDKDSDVLSKRQGRMRRTSESLTPPSFFLLLHYCCRRLDDIHFFEP